MAAICHFLLSRSDFPRACVTAVALSSELDSMDGEKPQVGGLLGLKMVCQEVIIEQTTFNLMTE